MNTAEKKVLRVAFFLFVVGILVRFLPWGLPAIDTVDPPSKLEYAVSSPERASPVPVQDTLITDKVSPPPATERPRKVRKNKEIVRFPLKINNASAAELCALKGVGPKLAEKIIAFREVNGPFDGPASLKKVPGIGKKKLEGILPWVIFD